MVNSDIELKNHILYEIYSGIPNTETFLTETRGYVSGLGNIINAFFDKEEIGKDILRAIVSGKEFSKEYNVNIKELGFTSFFETLTVYLNFKLGDKQFCDAEISIKNTFEDTESGIICHPFIKILSQGSSSNICNSFAETIGHELTHAYNLFSYAKKNNLTSGDIFSNVLHDQKYGKIMQSLNSGERFNEGAIANILYLLNRMERNSFIAELRQSLELRKDKLKDSDSCWKAVMEAESYKQFKILEDNINILLSVVDKNVQKIIVDVTNDIMGMSIKTFNDVKKYYLNRWNKWKKKYLATASKIAYGVYIENNFSIDGLHRKNITLKKEID